jgi:hypothetical protein
LYATKVCEDSSVETDSASLRSRQRACTPAATTPDARYETCEAMSRRARRSAREGAWVVGCRERKTCSAVVRLGERSLIRLLDVSRIDLDE